MIIPEHEGIWTFRDCVYRSKLGKCLFASGAQYSTKICQSVRDRYECIKVCPMTDPVPYNTAFWWAVLAFTLGMFIGLSSPIRIVFV